MASEVKLPELRARVKALEEAVRRATLDVNHALMVLPVPSDGAGKRAWSSLLDAKKILEAVEP